MTGAAVGAIVLYGLIGLLIALLLRFVGRPDRMLTPIFLFIAIEVTAVWPALIPTEANVLADVGVYPAILAGTALLATVVVYVLCGGAKVSATQWRGESGRPTAEVLRSMTIGLTVLVVALVLLGLLEFRGLPPLLSGGIGSLLDPLGNADQAALIRETRRSLTKGHTLLGDAYAGQGLINTSARVGWRIALLVALLLWTWTRNKQSLQRLLLVIVVAFLFLGSAGSRSPMLLCAVAGVAALALRYRLRAKHLVMMGLTVLGFILLITPLSKGATAGETASERLTTTIERVTDGNGENNAQIVALIDSGTLESAHGTLFIEKLQAMVPGIAPQDPFALRITRLAYGAGSQTTGYSTPTQYGLLYADGGAVGVIVGYALSGVLLAFAWRAIARIKSPYGAVVAVEGAIVLGYLSVTGVHGVMATVPVAALALFVAAGPITWRAILRPTTAKADRVRQRV